MSSIDSTITSQAPIKSGEIHPAIAPAIGFGIYLMAVVLGLARDASTPAQGEQGLMEWAVTLLMGLVGVGIAWWASSRAVRNETQGRSSLVLGVVALLTIVAFWAGLPCVFGASAIALGMQARQRTGAQGVAVAGILLGSLALVAGAITMVVG